MRGLADLLTEQDSFCQAVTAKNIRLAAQIAARIASRANSPQHLSTPDLPYSPDPQDVYGLQEDMLAVEEMIPWACVRKVWKNKRGSWRREVKQTSSVRGFAKLLKDLRQVQLISGDVNFANSEAYTLKTAWKQQLENCASGTARASTLDGVWLEFKMNMTAWITSMTMHAQEERLAMATVQSSGGGAEQFGTARDTVAPGLIVRVLERHQGSLLHVPVESMLGDCPAVRLAAMREVLGRKKAQEGDECGREEDGEDGETARAVGAMGVARTMEGDESEFDSGVSTDEDEALTDFDEMFDTLL